MIFTTMSVVRHCGCSIKVIPGAFKVHNLFKNPKIFSKSDIYESTIDLKLKFPANALVIGVPWPSVISCSIFLSLDGTSSKRLKLCCAAKQWTSMQGEQAVLGKQEELPCMKRK